MDENDKISKLAATGSLGQGVQAESEPDAGGSIAPQRREASAIQKNAKQSPADQRKARAAAKLRENLLKRKQQLRARRAGDADETIGLPAAKLDESS